MKTKHINENKRLNYLHSEIDALYHMSSLKLGISDSVSIVMYAICDLGEGCMLSDIYKSSGVSKQTIAEMRNADGEEVKEVAKAIEEGKPVSRKPRPMSPQMKDFSKKLLDVVSEMENTNKAYTLDDAIRDLNSAEDVFISQIEFVLEERKEVIDADKRGKEQVAAFIESVINDLNNLKGRFI